MPRVRKQATEKPSRNMADWDFLVRIAKDEAAKATEVSKATRLTYQAKAEQLAAGWDLGSACKSSRYAMRAAGLWTMRRRLHKLIRTAEKIRKNGITGEELHVLREELYLQELAKVRTLLNAIQDFTALPWSKVDDPKRRLQDTHKQKAATDTELVAFYRAAKGSSFYNALLVAEFSGCRGEEFREGVRIEISKKDKIPTLRFFVQSAKADGKKKGLDMRAIDVPFPAEASDDVKRRWLALSSLVTDQGKSHIIKITPTEKQTAGQRFTNACKFIAKKAGVNIAAYSLRHRLASQVKEASGGDAVAVALALGHQTTETQRHYARSKRGGGDVSPMQSTGVNVSNHRIRGDSQRVGPKTQIKEKVTLAKALAKLSFPAPSPPKRL